MGLLSSRASITCYRVEGGLPQPITENVFRGLKQNAITNIDDQPADKAVGWSSFEDPFGLEVGQASINYGPYLAFSLRMDKKTIPARVVKKYCQLEAVKKAGKTGRSTLSKNERQNIREKVMHQLALRIPATPSAYDLVWDYQAGRLWFFTNLKGANEELETLFFKSFSLRLIRLFPYTIAALESGLTDEEKDRLFTAAPTDFSGPGPKGQAAQE